MSESGLEIAIVDYEMGNLFSVKQACQQANLNATITSRIEELKKSDGIILPGVGAFGDATEALKKRNLFQPLKELGELGKPLLGICLGMQLLMSKSYEFGEHNGFDFIEGAVKKIENPREENRELPVPEVGWNQIHPPGKTTEDLWKDGLLDNIPPRSFMYFVHSYFAEPKNQKVKLAETTYGNLTFCSVLRKRNILGCQFHPERSGNEGLKVYENFKQLISKNS